MCLGVPGRVVRVREDGIAEVDFGGGFIHEVDATTSPTPVKPGDYVIVHAGIIIARLDPEEGKRYLELHQQLMEEMMKLIEEEGAELEA
ncbi:MAG: HypC/HybG/HupF family hydrogenase formation chaperone [Crenarchaeota archaeon]|nr:HypC/HybG/HupF family hydrogenase formation chaperone [Thermoproteota archaeon]